MKGGKRSRFHPSKLVAPRLSRGRRPGGVRAPVPIPQRSAAQRQAFGVPRHERSRAALRRVWRLAHAYVSAGLPGALDLAALSDEQKAIRRATHLAIRQASIEGSRLYPR